MSAKPRPFRTVSKYRAKRTGEYASRREAQFAAELAVQKQAGVVLDWLEQVGIKLAPGVKYVVDFQVFMADGSVRFVEIKGVQTPVWRIKLKLLEEARPWIFSKLEVLR